MKYAVPLLYIMAGVAVLGGLVSAFVAMHSGPVLAGVAGGFVIMMIALYASDQ